MKYDLLILGAGQYSAVVKETAEAMGCFEKIAFLDDNSPLAIGKLEDIETLDYKNAFVAIGNPKIRELWMDKIKTPALLIHPKAFVSASATVAKGCIVEAGAVICSNAQIGRGTIVMSNAVVGHDATVGEFCQLKYNCSVPERCIVLNETKVECNVVYCDANEISAYNERFLMEEKARTGVESSFF